MLRKKPNVIALTLAILGACAIIPHRVSAESESYSDTSLSAVAMYAINKNDGTLFRYDFSECQLESVGVVHSNAGVPLLGIEASAYIPGFQNLYCFWTDPADQQNKLIYVNTETAAAAIVADDLEGGRITGAVASTPMSGTSSSFDGIADVLVLPHVDSYLLDSGTITFRVKADSTSGSYGLFSKDSTGYDTGGHIHIHLDGAYVKVRLQSTSNSYYAVSSTPIAAGTWHQIALTFGSAGLNLYLDGTLVGSDSYTGGLGVTSGGAGNFEPIVLGANQWASGDLVADNLHDFFAGEIGEFQIIDRVLGPSDLGALSAAPANSWTVFAVQHAKVSPPVVIAGSININPNNSPQNEFELVGTRYDGTSITITRDDLHQNSTVDAGGVYYTGYATTIHVKPKGNGSQNGLLVDGAEFIIQNSNTYVFNGTMNVEIYNDHIHSNGKAMGQWWLRIVSGTIVQDDQVELPDRLISVDHKTGVVTEIMALARGYDTLATVDGQVFYATVGQDLYRLDAIAETETLLGAVAGADLGGLEFCQGQLWGFDLAADNLRACDTAGGTASGSAQVGATDLGTIVFVPLPADPANKMENFD